MAERVELEVGQVAPPIHATTSNGDLFDLSDRAGAYVVVYFYPRANTPG